ncbi:hypothetical protein C1645_734444 [Glomus cerebriforme]|uniref:Uncharacterized protein n=1 Tax=Glomus cerebriforme TaxID=658196 RepID=A0A397TIQ6_9GLOM|nr:hypothetical protein C1645_734444 [Glomus cerebriforme]
MDQHYIYIFNQCKVEKKNWFHIYKHNQSYLPYFKFDDSSSQYIGKRGEPSAEKKSKSENGLSTIEKVFGALGIFLFSIFLIICYLIAVCTNRKGDNSILFSIPWTILDFVLDVLFIVKNGKDVPSLYVPRFNAPFSDYARTMILWGCVISSITEDLPQFLIQVLYKTSRGETYSMIPFLKLITVSIKLPIGIIGRVYEALKDRRKPDRPSTTNNDNEDREK